MMSLQELSANDTWIESAAAAASAMMPGPLFPVNVYYTAIPADTGRYLTIDMYGNGLGAIPAAAGGY